MIAKLRCKWSVAELAQNLELLSPTQTLRTNLSTFQFQRLNEVEMNGIWAMVVVVSVLLLTYPELDAPQP